MYMSDSNENELIDANEVEVLSDDECFALDILERMGTDASIQEIHEEIKRQVKDEVRRIAILSRVGLEKARRCQQVFDVEFGYVNDHNKNE